MEFSHIPVLLQPCLDGLAKLSIMKLKVLM